MFSRRSVDTATDVSPEKTITSASAPKGRPTPKRQEAERARKSALKAPANTKQARRAERQQMQAQRAKTRQAMLDGDPRALPPRDQGPVKMFVRNFVDSRRTVGEVFVPIAVIVLVMGLTRNPSIQAFVTLLWLLIMLLVVVDTGVLIWRLKRALQAKWPDKADRSGVTFYAIMRTMQIRRLRMPPPQFRAGGKPVKPKQPRVK